MKTIALLLLLMIGVSGCSSSRKIVTKKTKSEKVVATTIKKPSSTVNTPTLSTNAESSGVIANRVVKYAFKFDGTKYKLGGTTKKGMDCSGLVTTAFQSEAINLPRTTRDIALVGNWVDLKEVEKGDLLFFATRKNSRTINHVGIVTQARQGYVEFIHASTSKGVIVSNLAEKYWYFAFVQARRII